jgi:predicted 3-demethylubiquinone-9 3-methyltransferase (glyoxalase superfamily)
LAPVIWEDILEKGYPMQKITPFLWFDNQAEEAMNFYVAIFTASCLNK